MSTRLLLSVFIACASIGLLPLRGQTVLSGQKLELGPSGTTQINSTTNWSGAIGQDNQVKGHSALTIGDGNSLWGFGSLTVGSSNTSYGLESAMVGSQNTNLAWDSLMVGLYNSTSGDSEYGWGDASLVVGYLNSNVQCDFSLTAGANNVSWYLDSAMTLGYGLVNYWSDSTVVGHYNLAQNLPGSILFLVGNGADATHRNNAIEVYTDGTIVIPKAQGDILMGEFGSN